MNDGSVDVKVPLEAKHSILVRVVAGVALLSALVGGALGALAFVSADGAPQQAAAAAMACACAVVPYVILRAIEMLTVRR